MVYKTSISFTTEQAINSLTVKEEDYSEVFYAPFANETTLLTMRFEFSGSDGSYTATLSQIPGTEWDGGANVYVSAPGYRPTNMSTIANTGSLIPKNALFKAGIAFCVRMFELIIEINTLNIKLIDLLGSFGISFFSSSKNFFNPLFINLVVIYVARYRTTKLSNPIINLYLVFCQKTFK